MKDWDLYVVVSSDLTLGRPVIEVVRKALEGGADVIQMREKNVPGKGLVELGEMIREETKNYKAGFIVNDRVDVALAVEADGVHIGQEDIPIEYVRKIVGREKYIGLSAAIKEEAIEGENKGADYIGIGPIFKTDSKTDINANEVGLEGLMELKQLLNVPLVAIGGIKHKNALKVIESGADAIAVISAVTCAENIEKAAQDLKKIILKGKGKKNDRS